MIKRSKLFHAVALFSILNMQPALSLDVGDAYYAAPEIQLLYLGQDLGSAGTIDIGKITVGNSQNTSYFTLTNLGDADLIVSNVAFSGTDADIFATDLTAGTVTPGSSLLFRVTSSPVSVGEYLALLTISSDDADEGVFEINFTCSGLEADLFIDLYGPQDPPPRDMVFSSDGNGVGRAGGLNYRFANVNLAAVTPLYWGTFLDTNGDLEVKLSMDDSNYTGDEIMAFDPVNSDLTAGILTWIGKTSIKDYLGTSYVVYTRFVLNAKTTVTSDPIALIDPARLKMDNRVGGLVPFTDITDQITVNMLFEASLTNGTGYQPYLDFYDTFETDPQATGTVSSFWPGFFWNNVGPRISANTTLALEEGETVILTTSDINVLDDEDSPSGIRFEFVAGTGEGTNPLKHGELLKDGVPMTEVDHFTMQDVIDGLIVYVHDGTEVTEDNFVFKAKDSRDVYVQDGPYTEFTFRMEITIINDSPEVENRSFTINCGDEISDILTATDEEGGEITFEAVTIPSIGVLDLNTSTGAFTLTGIAEAGFTSFQYRAFDGNSYSDNALVEVSIDLMSQSIDFTDVGIVKLSQGSITLEASATSGLAVSFSTTDSEIDIVESAVSLLQTGEVSITASQAGDACYSEATPVIQDFCIEPDPPVITASGLGSDTPVLTSSAASGNQWYRNSSVLVGETNQSYAVTDEGSFVVTTTENGCESQFSTPFIIVITSLEPANERIFEIYPNPSYGLIRIDKTTSEVYQLQIADLSGRIIQSTVFEGASQQINVSDLEAGLYNLLIFNSSEKYNFRILKR